MFFGPNSSGDFLKRNYRLGSSLKTTHLGDFFLSAFASPIETLKQCKVGRTMSLKRFTSVAGNAVEDFYIRL